MQKSELRKLLLDLLFNEICDGKNGDAQFRNNLVYAFKLIESWDADLEDMKI